MPSPATEPTSVRVNALLEIERAHPVARKILVAPSINWGREILRHLARLTGGWVGWEPVTLRGLADDLALVGLERQGRRAATDVEIEALVGAALDAAAAAGALRPRTIQLVGSPGFRRAVTDALLEVRLAGVTSAQLLAAAGAGPAKDLVQVLERYLLRLAEAGLTDPAGVFEMALAEFDTEAPFTIEGVLVLAPGLAPRGLTGRLLDRLKRRGGIELAFDLPAEPPNVQYRPEIFIAATPADEVREALRRALAEGRRLDEIEIAATDPDTYGTALDALARSLDISATQLTGLPLARSRIGRALDRWLDWLERGLPADLLRQLIEAGDLDLKEAHVDAVSLGRALRSLRIGWGRPRYEDALRHLGDGSWVDSRMPGGDALTEEERMRRRAALHQQAETLRTLLEKVLALTPAVPGLGGDSEVNATVNALAQASHGFVGMVSRRNGGDANTAERLANRLKRIAEVPGPARPFRAALAELREGLSDFRVWSEASGVEKPWNARGGAVHFTDLAHAGTTGRPRVFVLGLDQDRVAGPRLPDPLLPERVREALGAETIATVAIRREERQALVARALAGLRGEVTLSFAAIADLTGHEAGPAPVLLDLVRQQAGNENLSYADLRGLLGAPNGAVPAPGRSPLDRRDAWLAALSDGAMLLDGTAQIRETWPDLDRGLSAADVLEGTELDPHLGHVPEAALEHDPTRTQRPISPSSLERLGTCPLAWFYRYVLGLYPPDDPEYDPDLWLDPLQRGRLLHEVFDQFERRFRGRQQEILEDPAEAALLEIVAGALARWREEVPPPSETVRLAEETEIRRSALSFLAMERRQFGSRDHERWEEIEFEIDPARSRYTLPDGSSFALRGRMDRVDRRADGGLVVIDHKTGVPAKFLVGPKDALFRGGRLLQPALYAAAAEQQLGGKVLRFEYRFPTPRGRNEKAVFPAAELDRAPALVLSVLSHTRDGTFIPTDKPDDCTWCDYRSNCRVRDAEGRFSEPVSPRAEWARRNATILGLMAMAARRNTES